MQNPEYIEKYKELIAIAEKDPQIQSQVLAIKNEIQQHENTRTKRICGTSFHSKLYFRLLAEGLVPPIDKESSND
jgi:hypothetical protein